MATLKELIPDFFDKNNGRSHSEEKNGSSDVETLEILRKNLLEAEEAQDEDRAMAIEKKIWTLENKLGISENIRKKIETDTAIRPADISDLNIPKTSLEELADEHDQKKAYIRLKKPTQTTNLDFTPSGKNITSKTSAPVIVSSIESGSDNATMATEQKTSQSMPEKNDGQKLNQKDTAPKPEGGQERLKTAINALFARLRILNTEAKKLPNYEKFQARIDGLGKQIEGAERVVKVTTLDEKKKADITNEIDVVLPGRLLELETNIQKKETGNALTGEQIRTAHELFDTFVVIAEKLPSEIKRKLSVNAYIRDLRENITTLEKQYAKFDPSRPLPEWVAPRIETIKNALEKIRTEVANALAESQNGDLEKHKALTIKLSEIETERTRLEAMISDVPLRAQTIASKEIATIKKNISDVAKTLGVSPTEVPDGAKNTIEIELPQAMLALEKKLTNAIEYGIVQKKQIALAEQIESYISETKDLSSEIRQKTTLDASIAGLKNKLANFNTTLDALNFSEKMPDEVKRTSQQLRAGFDMIKSIVTRATEEGKTAPAVVAQAEEPETIVPAPLNKKSEQEKNVQEVQQLLNRLEAGKQVFEDRTNAIKKDFAEKRTNLLHAQELDRQNLLAEIKVVEDEINAILTTVPVQKEEELVIPIKPQVAEEVKLTKEETTKIKEGKRALGNMIEQSEDLATVKNKVIFEQRLATAKNMLSVYEGMPQTIQDELKQEMGDMRLAIQKAEEVYQKEFGGKEVSDKEKMTAELDAVINGAGIMTNTGTMRTFLDVRNKAKEENKYLYEIVGQTVYEKLSDMYAKNDAQFARRKELIEEFRKKVLDRQLADLKKLESARTKEEMEEAFKQEAKEEDARKAINKVGMIQDEIKVKLGESYYEKFLENPEGLTQAVVRKLKIYIGNDTAETNKKYDEQLLVLLDKHLAENEPIKKETGATGIEGAVTYLSIPNKDGSFMKVAESETFSPTASFFELKALGNNRFELNFRNEKRAIMDATNAPDRILKPVFIPKNALDQNATKITVTKPAILELKGGEYLLVEKGELYYGDAVEKKETVIDQINATRTEMNRLSNEHNDAYRALVAGRNGEIVLVMKMLDSLKEIEKLDKEVGGYDNRASAEEEIHNRKMAINYFNDLIKEFQATHPEINSDEAFKNFVANSGIDYEKESKEINEKINALDNKSLASKIAELRLKLYGLYVEAVKKGEMEISDAKNKIDMSWGKDNDYYKELEALENKNA